ncbi:MAG TPA: tetratricopeptide repeat protein [Gemmataceae bacterium]|nr:tetratricopeptide repeat protein [Gemmataceae bacterium]
MIRPLRNLTGAMLRYPLLSFLALLLLVIGAGAASAFLWSQYQLDAARKALGRYAFDEAQHHLDLCLKVRWRSPAVHFLAAQTARRRDDYEEAEKHLEECIRLGGMTPEIALEKMLASAQQGDFDRDETSLRARTTADDPDAVLVLEALAKGYASRFWDSNTIVCLNFLLERQPAHPLAMLMRARAWENRARKGEMERDQDALRDYEKAVELALSFEARQGLAGTLYRVGRPWEAALLYERLRSLQPANPALLLGLARCRYNLHEVDEARQLLDSLLEEHPKDAGGLLERGRLALHAGQFEDAEKWLRRAAAAAPRYNSEAQRLLCRCLEAANKTAEARACLDELREREAKVIDVERLIARANREPQNAELRYQIALELMSQGREEDAVGYLYLILQQDRQNGPARQALADYFERTGQLARAARQRRAIVPSNRASTPSR